MPSSIMAQKTNGWMTDHGFVYLGYFLESAIYDIRYHGSNNFIGQPVNGYPSDRIVMTKSAAKALIEVEIELNSLGYGLKIFDTYRPQRAVNHFKDWAKDLSDTLTKRQFYPDQDKRYLFQLGYISSRSGHSRGSTIDVTLYYLSDCKEIDMGGPYDFFGERSHLDFPHLEQTQLRHRHLLRSIMNKYGFRSYIKEWWHYTLRDEPYPDTYFDFVVE